MIAVAGQNERWQKAINRTRVEYIDYINIYICEQQISTEYIWKYSRKKSLTFIYLTCQRKAIYQHLYNLSVITRHVFFADNLVKELK